MSDNNSIDNTTDSVLTPVVAIVGRPNVGKSTLFNRLTKSRDAIVANRPGLTRDRQYGYCFEKDKHFILVDTGGIGDPEHTIDGVMEEQSYRAIEEADLILFMVDAKAGLTTADEEVADRLRRYNKPLFFILNKIDGSDPDVAASEFHVLGFGEPIAIAAVHGRGINSLLNKILSKLPEVKVEEQETADQGIKLAIIGKPNVGKSTLVNRMLGEERVVVCDEPGTTRDSIFIPLERRGQRYTLIDTAGVRRRSRVTDMVEKFSVIKTLQSIEEANVVIFLVDARENIAEQDLKLLGHVLDAGRALVLAVNKWDGLSEGEKTEIKRELDRRLNFVGFAKLHFISALHGTNVGHLFKSVDMAYQSSMRELSTPKATELLEKAIEEHQPPLVRGRRIKLRYAHIGGHNPPIIVIHGNQTASLPLSYVKYLENFYRKALKLVGTPIRIELKSGKNPFEGKRDKRTPRQKRTDNKRKKRMKRKP